MSCILPTTIYHLALGYIDLMSLIIWKRFQRGHLPIIGNIQKSHMVHGSKRAYIRKSLEVANI